MNFTGLDFGVVEAALLVLCGLLGYLWRTQAADVRQTATDLNRLSVKFAEAKGSAASTERSLFKMIEELKESVHRVENLLLNGGRERVD